MGSEAGMVQHQGLEGRAFIQVRALCCAVKGITCVTVILNVGWKGALVAVSDWACRCIGCCPILIIEQQLVNVILLQHGPLCI